MAGADDLFQLVGLGTPFLYEGAAYGLFHWLDNSASDDAKKALDELIKVKDFNKPQIAAAVIEVFNKLYTRPLLSFRAFTRSALFTTVVATLFVYESNFLFFQVKQSIIEKYLDAMAITIIPSLFMNMCSDYVSLFVIRRWLVIAAERPVLSLLACSIIGAAVVLIGVTLRILVPLLTVKSFNVHNMIYYLFMAHKSPWSYSFLQEYFLIIPAILVFAWLPLFGVSLAIIRILNLLMPLVGKVQWFLRGGNDHPLVAVGYVAGMIVFVIAAAWQLVFKAGT